ncbi:thiol-disulfide oxidoreductase ResA [Radiobacillus deserti]|uniref:Thiol-disulfide oxidoreductase ResA n=1 Tax=Radiobacillus deserti TaxID=2594883 RepID=A0A516KGL7_9BACI|nr:thiol-disulfide oxidoreductase ResA [Radiobacillus deserti]QDP40506.1 thiol-disulfide oxidoreductase ResA [Radiobacillus deserti]
MTKLEEANKVKKNKKQSRLIFRTTVLLVLFAALVFALVSNFVSGNSVVDVGDKAPNFQLKQLNGEADSLQLNDLKGKGIMLNFWATYCEPCEDEMPYMQELYPEYKEKGVEIVAVSLDANELVINKFIDHYDLTFPVLHDKGQVMDLYGIDPLPTTFFINSEGEVVEKVSGALTLSKLEGYLQQIQPK